MTSRSKYVVDHTDPIPIIRVSLVEGEGVMWSGAKKQLRQWFLDQAAGLRQVNEDTYFNK